VKCPQCYLLECRSGYGQTAEPEPEFGIRSGYAAKFWKGVIISYYKQVENYYKTPCNPIIHCLIIIYNFDWSFIQMNNACNYFKMVVIS